MKNTYCRDKRQKQNSLREETEKTEKITPEMTLGDLKRIPELKEVADILIINFPFLGDNVSLGEMESTMSYDTESLIMGMQRLLDIKKEGWDLNLPLYSEEEILEQPDRRNAALTFFRGKPGMPYIILCSGGGYILLTNLTEGFPTAAQMNKYGYNVFVVTYRVNETPILPKPQQDVAAAVRYIEKLRKLTVVGLCKQFF